MKYNKVDVHRFVKSIPKGKITTPGLIAKSLGLNPRKYSRAVGQEVCKCELPGRNRVVLKKGWSFPHQNDDDCNCRAKQLRSEKILVSSDNRRILNAANYLWNP